MSENQEPDFLEIIASRLAQIRARIEKYCAQTGRNRKEINLVAVSKAQPLAKIYALLKTGHRSFAENKVQEAQQKWLEIDRRAMNIKLDFIGPLQSNKTVEVVKFFDQIHSLDRQKIAISLSKAQTKLDIRRSHFIQVNIAKETQKSGIAPEDLLDFLEFCQHDCALNIIGLMTLPPKNEAPAPYFAFLSKLARQNGLKRLSMGMSHDFEAAIRYGATDIRLGRILFGERE